MRFVVSVFAVAAGSVAAQAQFAPFTVNYSTATTTGVTTSLTAAGSPTGLTASTLDRAATLTGTTASNGYNSSGWTTGTSPDLGRYLTLTLTPTGGGTLDIDSISFQLRTTASGPQSAQIRTSVDGYAASIATATTILTATPNTILTAAALSGPAYDAITSPVTIRLYGYDAVSAGSSLSIRDGGGFAAATVSGQFNPVPEPATVSLLAAAGIGLAGFVRRRFC